MLKVSIILATLLQFSLSNGEEIVDEMSFNSTASSCTYSCGTKAASKYNLGSNGLNLITAFEGWSSTCYKDSVGVWTIGYGHACQGSSDDLPEYGVSCGAGHCSGSLTKSQGKKVLDADVDGFEKCVRKAVEVPITQNQFDALVSFSYNNGCGALQGSTFLKKLNAGTMNDKKAQFQLSQWHSGCLAGLERRRFTESQLWSSCASDFGCNDNACDISNKYPKCESNCEYCDHCGGCTGDGKSLPACVNP